MFGRFALAWVCLVASWASAAEAGDERVRVLVMEPTGAKFSADDRSTFAGLIAGALGRRPMFEVVTTSEVQKLLSLSANRELVGCSKASCLGEVAEALSARLVVFGSVNRLGRNLIFQLSLYDSVASKNVARATAKTPKLGELPSVLRQATDELVASVIAERRRQIAFKEKGTCPVGMQRIPGGQFFMGAEDDDTSRGLRNAKPSHNVKLSSFCIDMTEVTVAAYKACSDAGKCRRAKKTVSWPKLTDEKKALYSPLCTIADPRKKGSHPINCVTWSQADRFCKAQGARLPTEAEWEFAARGPDGRLYPWGDDAPTAKDLNACGSECAAWGKKHGVDLGTLYDDDDGWPATSPVGSFPAGSSRFGPHDVVGNVWEWVADRYAPYSGADRVDPVGPAKGKKRVVRGGAFNGSSKDWLRPAYRFSAPENQRSHAIGFRCARSLVEAR